MAITHTTVSVTISSKTYTRHYVDQDADDTNVYGLQDYFDYIHNNLTGLTVTYGNTVASRDFAVNRSNTAIHNVIPRNIKLENEIVDSTMVTCGTGVRLVLMGTLPTGLTGGGSVTPVFSTTDNGFFKVNQGYVRWQVATDYDVEGVMPFSAWRHTSGWDAVYNPANSSSSADRQAVASAFPPVCGGVNQRVELNKNNFRLELGYADSVGNSGRDDLDLVGPIAGYFYPDVDTINGLTTNARSFPHDAAPNLSKDLVIRGTDGQGIRPWQSQSLPPRAASDWFDGELTTEVNTFALARTPGQSLQLEQFWQGQQAQTALSGLLEWSVKSRNRRWRHWTSNNSTIVDFMMLDPIAKYIQRDISGGDGYFGQRVQGTLIRTVRVDNQDAAGVTKTTPLQVCWRQKTGTAISFRHVGNESVFLEPATTDKWFTMPNHPTHNAGLMTYVSRVMTGTGNATTDADYTDCDSEDNYAFAWSNGGIHRIGTYDISFENNDWRLGEFYDPDTDDYAGGIRTQSRKNDVAGLTTSQILIDGKGLKAVVQGARSTGNTTVTLDGLTDHLGNTYALTADDLEHISRGNHSLVYFSGGVRRTVPVSNVTFTGGVATLTTSALPTNLTDNQNVFIILSDHTWFLASNGVLSITIPANTDIDITYTEFAAMIHGKIGAIIDHNQNTRANQSSFTPSSSPLFSSDSAPIRTLMSRIPMTTDDFVSWNSEGFDVRRVQINFGSNSTLTLTADATNGFIDFGSTYTVPSQMTVNGAYADIDGRRTTVNFGAFPAGDSERNTVCAVVKDSDGTLVITDFPTVSTVGGNAQVTIQRAALPNNDDSDWYIATVSSSGALSRTVFQGPGSYTTTITANSLFQADPQVDGVGEIRFVPMSITTPGATETKAYLTNADSEGYYDVDDMNTEYLNTFDKLAIQCDGVNTFTSDVTMNNYMNRAKDQRPYAAFIAAFGTGVDVQTLARGVNAMEEYHRVRISENSSGLFWLFFDDVIPNADSGSKTYLTDLNGQGAFYGRSDFSAEVLTQQFVDNSDDIVRRVNNHTTSRVGPLY